MESELKLLLSEIYETPAFMNLHRELREKIEKVVQDVSEPAPIGGSMKFGKSMKFHVQWFGEMAAGIYPGSEEVEIKFSNALLPFDDETITYWQDAIAGFFDSSHVELEGKVSQ